MNLQLLLNKMDKSENIPDLQTKKRLVDLYNDYEADKKSIINQANRMEKANNKPDDFYKGCLCQVEIDILSLKRKFPFLANEEDRESVKNAK